MNATLFLQMMTIYLAYAAQICSCSNVYAFVKCYVNFTKNLVRPLKIQYSVVHKCHCLISSVGVGDNHGPGYIILKVHDLAGADPAQHIISNKHSIRLIVGDGAGGSPSASESGSGPRRPPPEGQNRGDREGEQSANCPP